MDVIFIFVCASLSCLARVDVTPIQGWFTLWCSRRIRRAEDPGFESQLRRPVSLLPAAIRSDAWSNIATIRLGGRPDANQFYSPTTLPSLSYIGF